MNEADVFSDKNDKIPITKAIKIAIKKMNPTEKTAFMSAYKRHVDNMYVEYKVMAK